MKLGQVLSSAQSSLNLGSSGATGLSLTGRLPGTSTDSSTGITSPTDATSKSNSGAYDPSEKSKGKSKAKGQQPKSSSDDDSSSNRGSSSSSSTPGSSSNR